jgi:hypothetical protein
MHARLRIHDKQFHCKREKPSFFFSRNIQSLFFFQKKKEWRNTVEYEWDSSILQNVEDESFIPDKLFVFASLESINTRTKGVLVIHPQILDVFTKTNIIVACEAMRESGDFYFEKFNVVLFPIKKETNWALFVFEKTGKNKVKFHLFDPCKKGGVFWKSIKNDIFRIWKVVCFKQNPSLGISVQIESKNDRNLIVHQNVEDKKSGFVKTLIANDFVEKKEFQKSKSTQEMKCNLIETLEKFEKERNWRENSKKEVVWKQFLPWKENSCYIDVIIVPLFFFFREEIKSAKGNQPIKNSLISIFKLMDKTKDQKGNMKEDQLEKLKTEFANLKKKLFTLFQKGAQLEFEWGQPNNPSLMMNCLKISFPELEIFNFSIWRERICSVCETGTQKVVEKKCVCQFHVGMTDCLCDANPKVVSKKSVGGQIEFEQHMFREFEVCNECGQTATTFTFLNSEVDFFFFEFPLKVKHFFPSIQVPVRDRDPVTYNAIYSIKKPSVDHFSSSWNTKGNHTEYDGMKNPNVCHFKRKWDRKQSSFILYKKSTK